MKIKILPPILSSLLKMSRGMTRAKELDPVLSNFLLRADNGVLSLLATNVELSLLARTKLLEIVESGSILVPSKILMEIVKTADSDVVMELTSEDGVLNVVASKSSWKIMLMKGDNKYPSLDNYEDRQFYVFNTAELNSGLKKVLTAISSDSKDPESQLVRISNGYIEATDGVKYQRCACSHQDVSFLMTLGAATSMSFILSESVADQASIGVSKDDLVLKVGDDVFVGQHPVNKFKDCSGFFSAVSGNSLSLLVNKKEFSRSLDKAKILSDYDTRIVKISITADELRIHCSDRSDNHAIVSMPCSWQGPSVEVGFNVDYLEAVIGTFDSADLDIRFNKDSIATKPIIITEEKHDAVLSQALLV